MSSSSYKFNEISKIFEDCKPLQDVHIDELEFSESTIEDVRVALSVYLNEPCEEIKMISAECDSLYRQLREEISSKYKMTLLEYEDKHNEQAEIAKASGFAFGFKVAARLMLESLK